MRRESLSSGEYVVKMVDSESRFEDGTWLGNSRKYRERAHLEKVWKLIQGASFVLRWARKSLEYKSNSQLKEEAHK